MSALEMVYVRRRVVKHDLIDGRHRTTFPEYRIWSGMLARCSNANTSGYARYGGRGITVCDRWKADFANFYEDMGPRPSKRHSIDRYPDNDGNYEPDNCRWATPAEQGKNKRSGLRDDAWTQKEIAELKHRWEMHDPVEEIAIGLGRSVATIRLRAFGLGLKRDAAVTRALKRHPELRPVFIENGRGALLSAVSRKVADVKRVRNREKQAKDSVSDAVFEQIIRNGDGRNDQMRALRLAGFTLERIGEHFGITRERVRQLQESDFRNKTGAERKINIVRPERRDHQVDRLAMAWNKASMAARMLFLEQATRNIRDDMPRLSGAKHRTRASRPSTNTGRTA